MIPRRLPRSPLGASDNAPTDSRELLRAADPLGRKLGPSRPLTSRRFAILGTQCLRLTMRRLCVVSSRACAWWLSEDRRQEGPAAAAGPIRAHLHQKMCMQEGAAA